MTAEAQINPEQTQQKPNDKEYNFRALEARLKEEQAARKEAEKRAQELERISQQKTQEDDDDSSTEPYVDDRRLAKKLNKFGENTKKEFKSDLQSMRQSVKDEIKQEMWLEQNPDFYEVLQHAEKFAQKAPKLAETILRMPEGFERQKLVYENIKTLGIDRPEQKQPSVQEKIDANKRSPYYQPSGVAAAPYSTGGDFSQSGQKNAYAKMQELKSKLRI
jgi:hypothetical protein